MGIQVVATHQGGEPFPGAAAPTGGNDWYSHGVWAPWATEVEWQINLEAPTGVPTSGAIAATFEIYVPDYIPNASQEQVANSKWVPVALATHPTIFRGGADWPSTMITFGDVAAVLVHARLRTAYRHRVHLVSTFAGGTSPGCALRCRSIARS